MITLHLDKEQAELVRLALSEYAADLRKDAAEKKPIAKTGALVDKALFQIDVLETWLDRQLENRA